MLTSKRFVHIMLALASLALLASACLGGAPQTTAADYSSTMQQRADAEKALTWLRTQQLDNGSFDAGFGHAAGVSCDAALAIVASGGNPSTWRKAQGLPSVMDYLAANWADYAKDAGSTGKLIVTVAAAGQNPKDWNGQNLVTHLQSFSNGAGAYDPTSPGQAWAILGLAAAHETIPSATLSALKSLQLETGAWPSAFGPDNDTAGYVLQALVAGGEPKNSASIQKTLAFLQSQQNEDGGFPAIKPSDWGTDTNANSTASVILGLLAVGEDPRGKSWSKSGGNPVQAVLRLQAVDGQIEFQPGVGSPLMSTVQAIPALLGKSLPLRIAR